MRVGRLLILACILSIHGCAKARRYPPALAQTQKPNPMAVSPSKLAWSETDFSNDVPIRFVPPDSAQWQSLAEFWNPPTIDGVCTLHFGQHPLAAAAAMLLPAPAIQIKVPLGLPDPTPYIPAANPPTLKKWQLGKVLFNEQMVFVKGDVFSCADCHPAPRFTAKTSIPPHAEFNPPSLINCVYNRRQFWDGRVESLEQTLVRTLDDETQEPGDASQAKRHAWSGVVKRLRKNKKTAQGFKKLTGTEPTVDMTAKALATYLRTILSGDSVYDRAEQARKQRNGLALEARDFAVALDDVKLPKVEPKSNTLPQQLAEGWRLFQGKAGCARCHNGPLFTDHDYHNISIRESTIFKMKTDAGRIRHVPIGLKIEQYVGAFRTPSLRNLPLTSPYMHSGGKASLADVLRHYNEEIQVPLNRFLDPALLSAPNVPRRLDLSENELTTLGLFLRSLNGGPIQAPIVDH